MEIEPNPRILTASAGLQGWPAYGASAGIVGALDERVIDRKFRNLVKRFPVDGKIDEKFAGLPLAGEAIGFRVDHRRPGRFHVGNLHRTKVTLLGCLFVPMRKGMVLRAMSRNDRNQTEKSDPVRFHRENQSAKGDLFPHRHDFT